MGFTSPPPRTHTYTHTHICGLGSTSTFIYFHGYIQLPTLQRQKAHYDLSDNMSSAHIDDSIHGT